MVEPASPTAAIGIRRDYALKARRTRRHLTRCLGQLPVPMHFESDIIVRRDSDAVADFLADPHNPVKWDRSVASVEAPLSRPVGAGYPFATIGPTRGSTPQHPACPGRPDLGQENLQQKGKKSASAEPAPCNV
jgi:hypothetical protein